MWLPTRVTVAVTCEQPTLRGHKSGDRLDYLGGVSAKPIRVVALVCSAQIPSPSLVLAVSLSAVSAATPEQREVDRLGHRLVARVPREVIAAIVLREHPLGIVRVSNGLVEVDDTVEGVARPYELVDRLADLLAFRCIAVSPADELLVTSSPA